MGKGDNPKTETFDPCQNFQLDSEVLTSCKLLSEHLILMSSIFDKILRILNFSGKIGIFPADHFPIQIPL